MLVDVRDTSKINNSNICKREVPSNRTFSVRQNKMYTTMVQPFYVVCDRQKQRTCPVVDLKNVSHLAISVFNCECHKHP